MKHISIKLVTFQQNGKVNILVLFQENFAIECRLCIFDGKPDYVNK